MRLLELRHVDREQFWLYPVEEIGQRECRLRLAHAARADQQEHADGLSGIFDPGARRADAAADGFEGVRLPDDPRLQVALQAQGHLHLVAQHLADRDPGPTDRKSTRLNSSHGYISYAVFCLKKKKTQ